MKTYGFFYFFFLWPSFHEQSPWLFSVISMSDTLIIKKSWVWYSHNIPPMIQISIHNITQSWSQATCLGVMIGWCSPDCQHGRFNSHPANVGCSFFRYTNGDLRCLNNQRCQFKAFAREDNQIALHSYFRNIASQRWSRKRMIKIW